MNSLPVNRITIDGREFHVEEGKNLLEASLSLGFDLPYFCWHPALGSIGACRLCAVKQFRDEKDAEGKIVVACMTPVSEGTRISIADEDAKTFRAAVIEWLMLNHPHDCPICDEGGECHLQDMTVMTGHDYRRNRFPKRTFQNQDLGPFVNHEMNRCIECYRCVRFYHDHAGGRDLEVFAAHDHVYFGRQKDGTLESEFSGNLVEVCPTGVFTDKTLKKHYNRKWDLQSAPTLCPHCGLGCNVIAGERYGGLRRILNRYNHEVNGYFLCDRGRFGYEFVNGPKRLRRAVLRRDRGEPREPIGIDAAIKELVSLAADRSNVLGIGSPRASLEANFLLRRITGRERYFPGLSERDRSLLGSLVEILGRCAPASLHDVESADAALVLGEDLLDVAPRMALALRQIHRREGERLAAAMKIPPWNDAAVKDIAQGAKAPLFLATPFETRLDDAASELFREPPAEIARLGFAVAEAVRLGAKTDDRAGRIARALLAAERSIVVAGTSLGEPAILDAADRVVRALRGAGRDARLAPTVPECNSLGAALLSGGSLEEALRHARELASPTLIVLENDLFRRAPRPLVKELLSKARRVVVIDAIEHETSDEADLLLPAGTFAESDGTWVNNEGRAQRFFRVFVPDAEIRESWRLLVEVLARTGDQRAASWKSLDPVREAMIEELPELLGIEKAAPPASFRVDGQRISREPDRYSGRTAIHARESVHEPKPPEDPDSPLSFSMEGYRGRPPAPLVPYFWAPGWNSVQSVNKYQKTIGGPLEGGDGGARLFSPRDPEERPETGTIETPEAFTKRDGEWLFLPLYEIFGSEELSALAPAVAARAPEPYVLLSRDDATRLDVQNGARVAISLDGWTRQLSARVADSVAPGVAGLYLSGLAGGDGERNGSLAELGLPAWGRIERIS
jgi:NADH-quinone oxidoreductase subunit G